jgi:hypothetical protein
MRNIYRAAAMCASCYSIALQAQNCTVAFLHTLHLVFTWGQRLCVFQKKYGLFTLHVAGWSVCRIIFFLSVWASGKGFVFGFLSVAVPHVCQVGWV